MKAIQNISSSQQIFQIENMGIFVTRGGATNLYYLGEENLTTSRRVGLDVGS